jgi:hypothetical protein
VRGRLEFGRLETGFHFVPEGHAIVARRFIAGLAMNMICVPEGRLKLDLGCYESRVPEEVEKSVSVAEKTTVFGRRSKLRSVQSSRWDETIFLLIPGFQALRAWLRSCCPSGTKTIRPSKRLATILALMSSRA